MASPAQITTASGIALDTIQVSGLDLPAQLVGARPDPRLDIDNYDADADLMVLNMGPQHPSTHGVLRVKLFLDGEVCIRCIPYLGYLHRGVEKLCEKLSYVQIPSIIDKNDYVSPMMNELAVAMVVEKLMDVTPPPRAQSMRTVIAELQRIASHLLWIGTWALDMGGAIGGGATLFMHTFRERETILDLFENLTGCRFHYNHHTIGGQRHDIPEGWAAHVQQNLAVIERRIHEYEGMFDNPIFRARTEGVGVLDPTLAMECGVIGPNGRASGIDVDLRRDEPYAAYDQVDLQVAVETGGDCLARYKVRVRELRESIRIVREMVDHIPDGPICALKPVKLPGAIKPPVGEAYAAIESPRGELGTYLIARPNERGRPSPHAYRWKIRPPSYHALSLIPWMCVGQKLSDVIVVLGSLDPIMGEVDR